jgi:hypothetical protein
MAAKSGQKNVRPQGNSRAIVRREPEAPEPHGSGSGGALALDFGSKWV